MSVSVLTQHNDNFRSGANLDETMLQPSKLDVNTFGLLCSRQVEGQIYAQPLYVPNVAIQGTHHNVVYVATMENWVYAFDADDITLGGSFLWRRQVHPHPVPARLYGPNYKDISDTIGILSTPVIDPAANTMYLVAAAFDPGILNGPVAQAQGAFQQLLFALDLSTGNLRPAAPGSSNPVAIVGQAPGHGYLGATESGRPVDKTGGNARVTVPIFAQEGKPELDLVIMDSSGGQVHFTAMQHMQRPALLLESGRLYVAFGSHGDLDPYHGWVFLCDAGTLTPRGMYCTTPNGGQGGIWQAGEGLVADGNGNVYCGTGNGDSNNNPGTPDLGESFIRLRAATSSLDLDAYVTIFQDATNSVPDEDLGAASPTILPDGFLVGGGKDGNFYLVDPSSMTNRGDRATLVQQFLATRGPGSRARVFDDHGKEVSTHHIHGSPVVYQSPNHGTLVYVWGENEVLRVYRYDPATHQFPGQPNQRNTEGKSLAHGTMFASNDITQRRGMPGAMLSISANQRIDGTAILWACLPPFDNANQSVVDGILAAYDATNFDGQGRIVLLWHSHQNPNDDLGKFAKFCCPTIAEGKVFVATFSNNLRVYGHRTKPDGGYNLGFGGKTGLTLNGSARGNLGPLRLTGQHLFQAGSCFCSAPVNVAAFSSTFRFRITSPNAADGMTFCVQGEGPRALGGPGGGLGYGPDPVDPLDPGFRIQKSVALKFGLFDSSANKPASTLGFYQNGDSPTAANAIGGETSLDALGMNLRSGNEFSATLTYDGASLQVILRDLVLQREMHWSFPFNIQAVTGNHAFVGFTAGTGGLSANQDILSWQFLS